MFKKSIFLFTIFISLTLSVTPAAAKPTAVVTDAFSLIAEVNNLRTSNGLPAYTVSAILMATAQGQAEYMSVNGVSHIGPGGTRPYERVLNAGYPLAGDLSLGGFMSENITAGGKKSVQDAVLEWQGDTPHWTTMMSPDLMEIGAGVAIVDGYVYYVIDCARPLGARPPTLAPGETAQPVVPMYVGPPLARTVMPNTPNADGKLVHVVGPGETLWLIAVTYKVTVLQIRELNYMSDTDAIYPGEKLLIRKGKIGVVATPDVNSSATPTELVDAPTLDLPTVTFAPVYTRTPLPTLPLPTDVNPTSIPDPGTAASNWSLPVLAAIVLAALVLAAILVRAGRRVP